MSDVQEQFAALIRYFGESEADSTPNTLFGTLGKFFVLLEKVSSYPPLLCTYAVH